MLSRVFGLVRTLVFSQTVGASCLGTAYVTANQVPNLVYELVLGGALTSAMVPVLARSAERAASDPAEKARVGQITSALLTWSVLILVPFSLVIVVAATPIASVLNPANATAHCPHADMVSTTAGMLEVFAPQVVLYGLSVVLYGLLQAYRRFTGPALAPLISSLVLISAYLAFVPLSHGLPLARLPVSAELVLSVGTTLGVAALVLVAVVPTWRLRLRLMPTLRFPPGVARRAGGLALVGVIELIVDGAEFDRTCAGSTRAILLMSWLGTAVIAAIAIPAAHVLASQPGQFPELVEAFFLFAPGMAGIAVIANLSRVMFAIGRLKVAAAALAGSWVAVIVADVVLAGLAPPRLVVAALALGSTIGQTVVAVPLVIATRRICGPAAVRGVGHAAMAGLAAGVVSAAVGVGVSLAAPAGGKILAAGVAVVAAGCAVIVFGAAAYFLDRGDLKAVLGRLRRIVRSRS